MSAFRRVALLVFVALLACLPREAMAARRAVVIGVADYTDPDIPDLRYATADARAIATFLRERGGFADVTLLLDAAASRAAIQTALARTLPLDAREEDEVVVYFSGHGALESDVSNREPDGFRKYLLPADADPENLFATALDMQDVSQWLDWVPSRTLLLILDSCYAGGAGGRGIQLGYGTRALVRDVARPVATGRAVLMASQPNQVSLELESLGHGLFTWALLEGLDGAADTSADGAVTLTELYAWVEREVREVAARLNSPQAPGLHGTVFGDLVLSGSVRPPDPAQERDRLAAIEASVREREATLAERRSLAAETLRVTRAADAAEAVAVEEKVALWEAFLTRWHGEPGTEEAEKRLEWWRSANRTFLDVDTNVRDGEVWLDGELRGSAPRTLTDIPIGRHRLLVTRPLHHSWQADVVVPIGGLKVRADLKPAYGRTEVTSTPPGAAVFVGGLRVGTTPLTLDPVASGPLRVTLRLERYEPREAFVDVRDGELATVREALSPRFGTLTVTGAPAGATVSVGSRLVGTTPMGPVEVDAGEVDVRVEHPGFTPWSQRTRIVAGERNALQVAEMTPRLGALSVVSEPRGASVSLDGVPVGVAPLTLEGVRTGTHTLELRAGQVSWSGAVEVRENQVTTHTANLTTTRPGMLLVPAGSWRTGEGAGGTRTSTNAAYWIDRFEVSSRRYNQCVAAGACGAQHARRELLGPDQPAVGVTWFDADAYCRWASGRLPTGAEWERAARGTDGRLYPWGNAWNPAAANWNDAGKVDGFPLPSTVNAFEAGAAPTGALNMAGNALEWTSEGSDSQRYVRGGSALMEGGTEGLKTTSRFAVPPNAASEGIGFRCAANP
ncbi:MAG: PEGA domain-containing protein [Pseudomonadota bacterium]|nr:PEGA domain-containing protein [Pseudomonadota bacterium]